MGWAGVWGVGGQRGLAGGGCLGFFWEGGWVGAWGWWVGGLSGFLLAGWVGGGWGLVGGDSRGFFWQGGWVGRGGCTK